MKKPRGLLKGIRPWCLAVVLLTGLGMGCGDTSHGDAVTSSESTSLPQTINSELENEVENEFQEGDGENDILARAVGDYPGQIALASTSSSGVSANANSYGASLSADGKYLAFVSTATNLSDRYTHSQYQIYRKNLETGEIVCVSAQNPWTDLGNNRSFQAHISDNGRRVAFTSRAQNLVSGKTIPANIDQVYVARFYDTPPGYPETDYQLDLVTQSMVNWNAAASGHSYIREFSGDKFLALRSNASDLHYDDNDSKTDLFLTEIQENTGYYGGNSIHYFTQLWSRNNSYVKGNGNSTSPTLSETGDIGYFTTSAANLVPPGTVRPALISSRYQNNQHLTLRPGAKYYDIDAAEKDPAKVVVAVRNQANTAYELYYHNQGAPFPGPSYVTEKKLSGNARQEDGFAISDDGRFVVYEDLDNPEFSDADGRYDIYLYDAQQDKHYFVTKNSPNTGHAYRPTISDDGNYLAWDQGGKVWVSGNPALGAAPPATPKVVTTSATGAVSNGGWQGVEGPAVSDNGRYLTFASKATNLHPDATTSKYRIYRKDLYTGEIVLVSRKNGTNQAAESGWTSFISNDGNKVLFESKEANLGDITIPASNFHNIYERNISQGVTKFLMSKGKVLDMVPDFSPEMSHVLLRSYGSQNDHPQGVPAGLFESILEYFYPYPTSIQIPSYITQQYLLQTAKYSDDRQYLFASFSDPSNPSKFLLYRFSGYSYYGNSQLLITDNLYYSDFDCSADGQRVAFVEKIPGVSYSKQLRVKSLNGYGYGSIDQMVSSTQCSNVQISDDGRYLVYYDSNMQQGSNTGSGSDAYVYDVQSYQSLPLRETRVNYPNYLRISGDGRSVIFGDAPNSNTQLYVVKNPHSNANSNGF